MIPACCFNTCGFSVNRALCEMYSSRSRMVRLLCLGCVIVFIAQAGFMVYRQMDPQTFSYSGPSRIEQHTDESVNTKVIQQPKQEVPKAPIHSQHTTADHLQNARLHRLNDYCKKTNHSHKNGDIKAYVDDHIKFLRSLENTMLFDENHKVILRSIPKTGCSSWRLTFLNNSVTDSFKVNNQTEEDIHIPPFMNKYKLKAFSQLKAADALYRLEHYPTILTVRHPLDRMESAYVDKFTKPNIFYTIRNQHSSKILSLSRGQTLKNADPKEIQFDEFLRYLVEFPLSDIHWRSVWDQAHPCLLKYHYVAKQETMTLDLQNVTDRYLSGKHTSKKLKSWRDSGTQIQGKLLPLFSKLQDPEAWIQKLLVSFRHDMDMFGYSYKLVDGKVYAMCTTYTDDMLCV